MPQIKFTTTAIGLSIINDVENFIKTNAHSFLPGEKVTPDDGSKMLAHAIVYAITKVLASPGFNTALAAGLGPTNPGPLISAALVPMCTEPQ